MLGSEDSVIPPNDQTAAGRWEMMVEKPDNILMSTYGKHNVWLNLWRERDDVVRKCCPKNKFCQAIFKRV